MFCKKGALEILKANLIVCICEKSESTNIEGALRGESANITAHTGFRLYALITQKSYKRNI